MRLVAAGQYDGQRRAPATSAKDGDPGHSFLSFLPAENFGSTPSMSLWMLASCL